MNHGLTGGMSFYYFTLKGKNGKMYTASYSGYGGIDYNRLEFKEKN